MPALPYLHFLGQCAEAVAFYAAFSHGFGMVKDCFGTHWVIAAMPAVQAAMPVL